MILVDIYQLHVLIESELYAIVEFHIYFAMITLYLDNHCFGIFDIDNLFDTIGYNAIGYRMVEAVNLRPVTLAVKLYLAAIGEDDIVSKFRPYELKISPLQGNR